MYINPETITVGADPEFFVLRGRHFISGHHFQCGTKEEPMPTAHTHLQNDGVALECNVRPARTQDDFVKNCQAAISDLREFVKQKDQQADIIAKPSIFIGSKKLSMLPPHIRALGCTPDADAYIQRYRNPPDAQAPFRTGSGHVHIGWTEDEDTNIKSGHGQLCMRLVQELDYYLGLPSLLWDNDTRRRSLYGTPGSCRVKHYGVEYRVLSNKWLENTETIQYVFQQTLKACLVFSAGSDGRFLSREYGGVARDWIMGNHTAWHKTAYGKRIMERIG